ncbi:hypothetical protein GCM10009795_005290 [Nocardioides hankookensis]
MAALVLSLGQTVSLDTLVERVWGAAAPATATATLQRYVASLRRVLEPDRAAHEPPSVIVTDGGGYALRLSTAARDVSVLEDAVATARGLLSDVTDMLRPQVTTSAAEEAAARAAEVLQNALGLWRGRPYDELDDDPDASAERARIEDLRISALEMRIVAMLAIGRHAEVVGEVESMTTLHPLRERWWALYAIALVRSGRQGEALEALGTLRSILDEQLGVDPSAPLRDLQTAILRQDETLEWGPIKSGALQSDSGDPAVNESPTTAECVFSGPAPAGSRWPLVGRESELSELNALLARPGRNHATAALITGEAGIGKSRLAHELTRVARHSGYAAIEVHCVERDAPPLWPLRTALTVLADEAQPPDVDPKMTDLEAWGFGAREHVIEALLAASAAKPLLLVVDDVHWADSTTCQFIEELVSRPTSAALAIVLTRRTGAGDDRQMRRLAAAVARNEGVRVDLEGLTLTGAEELVRTVGGGVAADAAQLWDRSRGNPFVLGELALAGGALSGSLIDVVSTQIMTLPAATVTALQAASVIGSPFDVGQLAAVLGRDELETLDVLRTAVCAGLVVEQDLGETSHAFRHPVVGEIVLIEQSHAARCSWHALAARALCERGRLADAEQRARAADHWRQAGRSHAADGWRALLDVAAHARAGFAYAEEVGLLRASAELLALDLDAGAGERFEMLMLIADACRWSGDWHGVSEAVDEAVTIAERLGDDLLGGRAARALADSALWQVRPFGYMHEPTRDYLDRLLRRLDIREVALKCRVQVALAMELHFDSTQTGLIDSLIDDAVRSADATDDLELQLSTYHGAFVATWRPDTLERRAALAKRALHVAERLDDPRARVVAEVLSLMSASELGQVERVRSRLPRVAQLAASRGLIIPEALLGALALGWSALEGDTTAVRTHSARLIAMVAEGRNPNLGPVIGAAVVTAAVLNGDAQAVRRTSDALAPNGQLSSSLFRAGLLVRLGHFDAAHEELAVAEGGLAEHTFMGPVNAALACQLAASLGATQLTEEAYTVLSQHAGRMCSAGPVALLGPADLYLALGAKALGHQGMAETHLADASRIIRTRGLFGLQGLLDEVQNVVHDGPPSPDALPPDESRGRPLGSGAGTRRGLDRR